MEDTPAAKWSAVQQQVAAAAVEAGRAPEDITTIVVTKFHPSSLVRDLAQAGVQHVGENRHQEAVTKHAELEAVPLTWHFVGQLQSNKAKAVAHYCSVIHSVDRSSLIQSLAQVEKKLDVFLEVNLTDIPGRGGAEPGDILTLAETVLGTENLVLRGLMAVAPVGADPGSEFDRVVAMSAELQVLAPEARDLSLGMSGDFAEAISRGATHLRIGSAITGKRPDPT